VHVSGKVDPISDIDVIDTELCLADLASVEKAVDRAAKAAKGGDKDASRKRELLVRLREWATQPQFTYRHKWTVGDLVMWDNTGTMHRATPYDPAAGRLLHRTKLQGEEPFE